MSSKRFCFWCADPATTEVTVEPEVVKSVGGVKKVVHAARVCPACPTHSTFQATPPQPKRRRKPGADQMTVFDFLDRGAA